MNSKKIVSAALVTAAVATSAGFAVNASGQGAPGTTLTLSAKPTGGVPIDLGRKGVSPGDQFLEHGVLRDPSGHPAGHFQMVTQLVSGNARHGGEQSSLTLYLAGGQVQVTGGHATASRFVLPVVGGTGNYTGAAGTLTVAPAKGESEQLTVALQG